MPSFQPMYPHKSTLHIMMTHTARHFIFHNLCVLCPCSCSCAATPANCTPRGLPHPPRSSTSSPAQPSHGLSLTSARAVSMACHMKGGFYIFTMHLRCRKRHQPLPSHTTISIGGSPSCHQPSYSGNRVNVLLKAAQSPRHSPPPSTHTMSARPPSAPSRDHPSRVLRLVYTVSSHHTRGTYHSGSH